MEALLVDDSTYEGIQGTNDLEVVDHVSRRAKRRARRTERRSARKKKKIARKISRAQRKGKTKKVARLQKRSARKTKRLAKRATRLRTKGTIGERGVKLAKKGLKAAAFAPLLPLKALMVGASKSKGAKVSMRTPIQKVANEFYNRVVRKHKNFEDAIEIDFDAVEMEDNVAPALVTGVVSAIIEFVKQSKKKKEKGENMTKLERQVAEGAEKAEIQLEEKAKQEAATEVGSRLLFDKKTQLIVAGVIVAIIIAAVFIARKK